MLTRGAVKAAAGAGAKAEAVAEAEAKAASPVAGCPHTYREFRMDKELNRWTN